MEYPLEQLRPYGTGASKREEVEVMFNHIAPTYDRLNHLLSLGIDKRWRKRAIDLLRPYRPRQIMDVATGTGDFALLACRELQPEYVTGIDIAEGMMCVAREKAKQAGLGERISFVREDCTALTFADECFDAVTVAFGIRNFERLDKGLGEMCRVLRKGGRLVILELSYPTRFPMKQLYGLYTRTVMPVIGKSVSHEESAYTYLPRSIRAFPQGEVMSDILRKAGFGTVQFKRLTSGICTLYMATK